jgi:hypothetical protein
MRILRGMTLIVSAHRGEFAFQVSDRFATRRLASGRAEAWDATWNKSIILLASDALVAIRFSGIAYIDGKPTDEWATETLWGGPIRVGGSGLLVTGQRPTRSLGESLGRLVSSIDGEIQELPGAASKNPFHLVATGWSWRAGYARHVSIAVGNLESGTSVFRRRCRSKRREEARFVRVDADPPRWLSRQDTTRIERSVVRASTPEEIEDVLISEVRSVARRSNGRVGANCMSIRIPVPMRPVRIRFAPLRPPRARLEMSRRSVELGLGYAPCFVTPNVASLAAELGGGLWSNLGGIEIEYEAPGMESDGVSFVQGQPRRPPP